MIKAIAFDILGIIGIVLSFVTEDDYFAIAGFFCFIMSRLASIEYGVEKLEPPPTK